MSSVFSRFIGSTLVLLLGCVIWLPSAVAQDLPDEPIETLEGMEVSGTVSIQEERQFSIPKPDTTTFMPLNSLIAADIPKTSTVSQNSPKIVRDSIADRKGMWKFVRSIIREERPFSIDEPDTTTFVPLNGLVVATIAKTPTVSQNSPKIVRDSIADRKGMWKFVRSIIREERPFSIDEPDTTTFVPLNGLVVATIAKTPTVSQNSPKIVRDSIADRKGMWKFVRSIIREERPFSIDEPDTTTFVPLNGLVVATIAKTPTVSQGAPEIVRDSIADRKGIRKPVRLIRSDRPLYPQVARKQGWEGIVVLRITIGAGGDVEKVITQTSSGFPALDESAAQSVKTWQFDPAKDGEFPIATKVDLPVRFDLEAYGIQFSRDEPEPEPEPEPVREQIPARLIKSERPDYPQTARQQGSEGTVVLRITVGTGGNVENVVTQTSSGFPALDESAAQSVKTWQFDPAKDGDVPISTSVDLPVRFDLEEYKDQ